MSAPSTTRHRYGMAPVIRFTLLVLYAALVLPLPPLAPTELRVGLWVALVVGWVLVMALTSEAVVLDEEGLEVGHPRWCAWLTRRGWRLAWSQVEGLTPVATSQGGRVFYVRTRGQGQAWLLPQRVERFDDFLSRFQAFSGVDTSAVGRISPPWTYQLLAAMSLALLLGEAAWGLAHP
jgi:hypothetical protein